MHTMQFRRARPEDAPAAAELIYSAGPGALTYVFATKKRAPVDFIRFAFADGAGILGFKNHTVAESDDCVAAVGAFYDSGDFDARSREMVWQVFRFYGVRQSWGVLKRAAHLAAVTPRPKKNGLFIQNIGVAEKMRGRGVGTSFVQEQIEIAGRNRYERCILDVACTNMAARRFYERLGFRVAQRRNWPLPGRPAPVPDHIRMELCLGAKKGGGPAGDHYRTKRGVS